MFSLRGQPPCYQRAAWAAAGLREPPVATRNYTLADAMALHEAHRQGQAEGFVAGAAAEAEENRRRDEERDGAIRWALSQAAEAQTMAIQALQSVQQQQALVLHLQQDIEKLKPKANPQAAAQMDTEGPQGPVPDPALDFMNAVADNVKLFNVCRMNADEEPLSKRLRGLHEKTHKG